MLQYSLLEEYGGHVVRRIHITTSSMIISAFAGTGTASSSGDGSAASSATLIGAMAVFGDSFGNVYISEFNCFKVRIVNRTSGTIQRFAGILV